MRHDASQTCQYCRHNLQKGERLECHRNPPSLVAGPTVIKDPVRMPQEISLDPDLILPLGPDGDIYRVVLNGWPEVKEHDMCGEFEVQS